MDNTQLQEEVQSVRKLREHYESQLRLVGLELCDLPDEENILLDEAVGLRNDTNLYSLEESFLKEWYYTKKKESICNKLALAEVAAEIESQEQQLLKEEAECAALEKFTSNVTKRLVSEAEMQRNQIMLETKLKSLKDRQNTLNTPENFNVDELIKKIELLEHASKMK